MVICGNHNHKQKLSKFAFEISMGCICYYSGICQKHTTRLQVTRFCFNYLRDSSDISGALHSSVPGTKAFRHNILTELVYPWTKRVQNKTYSEDGMGEHNCQTHFHLECTWQRLWKLQSSGMWCHTIWYKLTTILKKAPMLTSERERCVM